MKEFSKKKKLERIKILLLHSIKHIETYPISLHFLCDLVDNSNFKMKHHITQDDVWLTRNYLDINKPTEDKFPEHFNHKDFQGNYSWWEYYLGDELKDKKIILLNKEKIKYLKTLIKQIDKELKL